MAKGPIQSASARINCRKAGVFNSFLWLRVGVGGDQKNLLKSMKITHSSQFQVYGTHETWPCWERPSNELICLLFSCLRLSHGWFLSKGETKTIKIKGRKKSSHRRMVYGSEEKEVLRFPGFGFYSEYLKNGVL